jgi:hypothetical protein
MDELAEHECANTRFDHRISVFLFDFVLDIYAADKALPQLVSPELDATKRRKPIWNYHG